MKKKILFYLSLLIIMGFTFLSSCNRTDNLDETPDYEISEADYFVNSEKFTTLQNVLKNDRKILALAYKSLSKENKRKLATLQEKGKRATGKERIEVAKEISELLDINFEHRIATLSEAIHNCFNGIKISNIDLNNAIRRKNAMTRANSDDYYRELQYQNCLDQCEHHHTKSCSDCYSKYVETIMIPNDATGGLDYETIYHEEYIDCVTDAYYDRLSCLSDCEYLK